MLIPGNNQGGFSELLKDRKVILEERDADALVECVGLGEVSG